MGWCGEREVWCRVLNHLLNLQYVGSSLFTSTPRNILLISSLRLLLWVLFLYIKFYLDQICDISIKHVHFSICNSLILLAIATHIPTYTPPPHPHSPPPPSPFPNLPHPPTSTLLFLAIWVCLLSEEGDKISNSLVEAIFLFTCLKNHLVIYIESHRLIWIAKQMLV